MAWISRVRGGGGAAGGQHVVDDDHPVARRDGVLVDLELVGAVLEVVLLRLGGPRELAGLADGDEPGPQPVRDGRRQHEPAGLDAHHPVDVAPHEVLGQPVDHGANATASPSSGVMSLNRMPGSGKSGTSRINDRRSSSSAPSSTAATLGHPSAASGPVGGCHLLESWLGSARCGRGPPPYSSISGGSTPAESAKRALAGVVPARASAARTTEAAV